MALLHSVPATAPSSSAPPLPTPRRLTCRPPLPLCSPRGGCCGQQGLQRRGGNGAAPPPRPAGHSPQLDAQPAVPALPLNLLRSAGCVPSTLLALPHCRATPLLCGAGMRSWFYTARPRLCDSRLALQFCSFPSCTYPALLSIRRWLPAATHLCPNFIGNAISSIARVCKRYVNSSSSLYRSN